MKYVDLFAGIGGFRCGIDAFAAKHSRTFHCVKSVDIKNDALKTYNHVFNESNEPCDICTVKDLPHVDLLCAGFPCQPFSSAGNKKGLHDEGRGNLIYEVIRICRESKPTYLLLENVSNIETIDKGETLRKITAEFEGLGYHITCCSINSSDVGLAQDRKRLFIVGSLLRKPVVAVKPHAAARMRDIIDSTDTVTHLPAAFVGKLVSLPRDDVVGKSIKDKRGGESNIHSWDIDYHGKITDRQKALLNRILLERRKKKWATEKKMVWMDGIPLSLQDIKTFLNYDGLEADLADAVEKKYLVLEHPKDLVEGKRVAKTTLPIGYNIAKGKLSFPVSKILSPDDLSPTLTATDSSKLAVYVGSTIRQLNETELRRLCGFPDSFRLPAGVNKYDLFGNMVCPPVITEILESLLLPPALL
jgi:DNA (cytosine-5)-methyltransferase 1